MKLTLEALGLPADATDEVAAKAVAELKTKTEAEVKGMSETHATALTEATTKLAETAAKLVESEKARGVLLAEKAEAEVKSFIDAQVKAGRVIPAQVPGVMELGIKHGVGAIKFLELAPVVVKMEEVGVAGSNDKRDAGSKKFTMRLDELTKTHGFTKAYQMAKAELPEEFALHFSKES